jgi:hypothetical protein
VVDGYAELIKRYNVRQAVDHYGGEFLRELFRKYGIRY